MPVGGWRAANTGQLRCAALGCWSWAAAPLPPLPPLLPPLWPPHALLLIALARREYLTGFHKRKVQRRKEALKKLERRQREQRLEERAEVGRGCVAGGANRLHRDSCRPCLHGCCVFLCGA